MNLDSDFENIYCNCISCREVLAVRRAHGHKPRAWWDAKREEALKNQIDEALLCFGGGGPVPMIHPPYCGCIDCREKKAERPIKFREFL